MMPFWCSVGGGSQEMLIDVLFSLPTIITVTCCGGALGAAQYNTYHLSTSLLQQTYTHTGIQKNTHTLHPQASRNLNGFLMAFLNDPDIWAIYCPLTIINIIKENSYCATSRHLAYRELHIFIHHAQSFQMSHNSYTDVLYIIYHIYLTYCFKASFAMHGNVVFKKAARDEVWPALSPNPDFVSPALLPLLSQTTPHRAHTLHQPNRI